MLEAINTFLLATILLMQLIFFVPLRDLRPTLWLLLVVGVIGAMFVSWTYHPAVFSHVVLSAVVIFATAGGAEAIIEHRTSRRMLREATAAYEQRLARGEVKEHVPRGPQRDRSKRLTKSQWLIILAFSLVILGGAFLVGSPLVTSPALKGIGGVFAMIALFAFPFALIAAGLRREAQKDAEWYDELYREYDQTMGQKPVTEPRGTEMEPRTLT